MDAMEKFVNGENVARFAERLYNEPSMATQQVLKRLLLEEENRFGLRSNHLELVQRHINEGAIRIDRQKRLIAEMEAAGHDVGTAHRTLTNFVSIQELFEQFRTAILAVLDRSAI
jgi:hypothetical protein